MKLYYIRINFYRDQEVMVNKLAINMRKLKIYKKDEMWKNICSEYWYRVVKFLKTILILLFIENSLQTKKKKYIRRQEALYYYTLENVEDCKSNMRVSFSPLKMYTNSFLIYCATHWLCSRWQLQCYLEGLTRSTLNQMRPYNFTKSNVGFKDIVY